MLIDTHCHIHESDYPISGSDAIKRAHNVGVTQMICIGTNIPDSQLALDFASKHDGVFASVGIHPHYAKDGIDGLDRLVDSVYLGKLQRKLVAIGEIGLDYHYENSPRDDQINILKLQIELALKYDLPIIFHVREAYDDFWKVFDSFKSDKRQIRGVLHCFTDTMENAEKGLKRGLYIAINGISTFTNDELQKEMFSKIPLEKILLETDAPYLAPKPFRGKINEPAFVKNIAEYNCDFHNVSFEEFSNITTANTNELFKLKQKN